MQAGSRTDTSLVEASCGGDRTAFTSIIERYHRAVYAVAFSGVRDRARAEDIAQDTFVHAWRHLDDLRDPERLAAWLCGIARNLARDARRRLQRESLGDVGEPIDAATPLDALTDAESERLIAAGLATVPDVYREPLVLFYYQDRSVDDVARTLGITPATTNKRLSRGRRFLAERVALLERVRGPSPAFVGAVVAAIALLPAPHVDASPLKGSTMSKIAIATVCAVAAGGIAVVAATTIGGTTTAHAKSEPTEAAAKSASPSCIADYLKKATSGAPAAKSAFHAPHASPALAASASSEQPTDCNAVGRHLAELEADATHGPTNRPDEATCEKCALHYSTACESQGWSAERRACTLAAGDLLNAHLCAGAAPQASAPTGELAPALQCTTLGAHIADVVHAAGLFPDVTDMNQQVDSACQLGSWPLELRQCFAAGTTVDALQACIDPNAH